jgi:hypothetical protein
MHPLTGDLSLRERAIRVNRALHAPVVPVRGKATRVRGWQSMRSQDSTTKKRLAAFTRATGVAVVLGDLAGGLCSIDCDSDEALNAFLAVNPKLPDTLITYGGRGGNVWVILIGACPRVTKLVRGEQPWGEFRGNGAYTVICGQHPSGCHYRSNEKMPISMHFKEIVWPDGVHLKATGSKERRGKERSEEQTPPPTHTTTTSTSSEFCISASLHQGQEQHVHHPLDVLSRVKAEKAAVAELVRESTHLPSLYDKYLAHRKAEAHRRNAFLVEVIPFLYRAVAPKFILPLVRHWYVLHQHLWRDPLEQHLAEAKTLIGAVEETYLAVLPEDSRELYLTLDERDQIAFRVLHDLAGAKGDFFMSCNELSRRLDCHPGSASALLNRFERLGIIICVKPGTQRATGQKGVASEFRWTLSRLPASECAPPGVTEPVPAAPNFTTNSANDFHPAKEREVTT